MNMFPTEEEKMEGMRSTIEFFKENFRKAIIVAYRSGHEDGYNEMYNADYAGSRKMEKPIEGEEAVVTRIMKTYL